MKSSNFSIFEKSLGYRFQDTKLLQKALTHRSYSSKHNERLEFLGDSVLNCAVSILIFEHFPLLDEGQLSRIRSHLVKQDCLALIARKVNLENFLFLGVGELRSSTRIKDSIVADALEAVLGAILLDSDFNTAKQIVMQLLLPVLQETPIELMGKDPKTRLQEYLQSKHLQLPKYTVVVEGGTLLSPEFIVECCVQHLPLMRQGSGHSRRVAEQRAAELVLSEILGNEFSDLNRMKGS